MNVFSFSELLHQVADSPNSLVITVVSSLKCCSVFNRYACINILYSFRMSYQEVYSRTHVCIIPLPRNE